MRPPRLIIVLAALLGLAGLAASAAPPAPDLPEYLRVELKRLEETWNILDQYAARVWPGWTGYRDVPFLFEYANGVRLLVGHPSPMQGFEVVPGLEVQGKKVYLDRRQEIPLDLRPPILGGGGPLIMGSERMVNTVRLHMSALPPAAEPTGKTEESPAVNPRDSENQILINIHELFHCFQHNVYRYRFGNLQTNTDADYAVYSEIEGLALEKAWLAPEPAEVRARAADFLAARRLKRAASMTALEANQESEDDLIEGTAVYSTTRTLELMKEGGYKPLVGKADDPWFAGFANAGAYFDKEIKALIEARGKSMEAKTKCYQYGSFQALLLSRLFPGWQVGFFQSQKLLAGDLLTRLGLSDEDLAAAGEGLKDRYPLAELRKKHGDVIAKRDEAWCRVQRRKGRAFIVDFKPAGEYLNPLAPGPVYDLGLVHIFPDGIEAVKVQDVLFSGAKTPIVQDQLYYVKWVDAERKFGGKGYKLTSAGKEGKDVYVDAQIWTGGFTLKAPKIRVQETKDFVKITILEKIRTPAEARR
ncbi:MAG: hypothetical protein NTZ26_01045 [Candidatus Aminicenantes bacterium]|nr:hypothetical protein [Candidatus Aminicenantes bacterium]